MKLYRFVSLVLAPLAAGCAVLAPTGPGPARDVFPRFTIFPSEEPLPPEVVAGLPRRIAGVRHRDGMTLGDLVTALGLDAHRANVSANLRWNHYFIYVDRESVIYIPFDARTGREEWVPFQTDYDVVVMGCKLMRNPDVTVVARDFYAEQEARSAG